MGITLAQDGSDLRNGSVRILAGTLRSEEQIATSTRVGVEYSGRDAAARPWRFFIEGSPHLSRGRPTDPARAAVLVAQRRGRSSGIVSDSVL